MSQVNEIAFTLNGVTYKFKMTYHPDNPCDQGMIEEFQKYGCCEPEVMHVMQRVIKPGMTVIDGGANVGFFTLVMSQMVGPNGKVIAIEPGENNLWKLELNLKLNKVKNVEIVRRPLWRTHEKVKLYLSLDPGLNTVGNIGMAFKEYDAVTLADYPSAGFIKLDIEGAEQATLEGDKFTRSYIVAEMNEKAMAFLKSSQEGLRGWMRGNGYQCFVLHKNGNLPSFVPENVRIIPPNTNTNVLFSTLDNVAQIWPEVRA
jgi:FkbM family methyltransferase